MNSGQRRLLGGVLVVFGIFLLTFSSSHYTLAAVNGGDPTHCEDKGDNDNDGVKNCADYCPEQSQGSNVDPNHPGCPKGVFDNQGCNNNYTCEANLGETVQNCHDCQTIGTTGVCPFKSATLQYFGTCPGFPQLNGLPTSATSYRLTATTTQPSCQYDTCTYPLYYNVSTMTVCPDTGTTTNSNVQHADLATICGDLHYVGGYPPGSDPKCITTITSVTHVPYNIDNPQAPLICHAPNVNLTNPIGGSTLAVPITITATVTGLAEAIQRVQFFTAQNDTAGLTAAAVISPYQSLFTPPTNKPGFYTIFARAVTTSGQTYDSHQVPIFVDPAPAPPPPPPPPAPEPLKIVAPDPQIANYPWAALRGQTTFQAIAQSNAGLKSATFSVDGVQVGTQQLNTAGGANGGGNLCNTTEIAFPSIQQNLFLGTSGLPDNMKVTDVTENPLITRWNPITGTYEYVSGGLREWSQFDPADRWWANPKPYGSGDYIDLMQTSQKMNSYCQPNNNGNYTADSIFQYLQSKYLNNNDFPVNFPVSLAFELVPNPGYKSSGHAVTLVSILPISAGIQPIQIVDPNHPGETRTINCIPDLRYPQFGYWNCDIYKDWGVEFTAAFPYFNNFDLTEISQLITALFNYCDPYNGSNHWSSSFCDRVKSKDGLKNIVKFDQPLFTNSASSYAPSGACAGQSNLTLRSAYLANFTGEGCRSSTAPQNVHAQFNTNSISDGLHTLTILVTDDNNKTQTTSQTFLVGNNESIQIPPECADGIDNDGDGRFDYLRSDQSNIDTYDTECLSPNQATEAHAVVVPDPQYQQQDTGNTATKGAVLGALNFTPTWQPITSFFQTLFK